MSQLNAEPQLSDENWRSFVLEKERNSALARSEWARYRRGLKRLERKYLRRVPAQALRQALAEDAFFCGAHWKHAPRIVRGALRTLLRHHLDLRLNAYVAAEYWAWADAISPTDLETARRMVECVKEEMRAGKLPPAVRENLERMIAAVVQS